MADTLARCARQAFNRRKERNGAFWEDRYHATAVERGEHKARCVAYIDLNMVRAGVATHPEQWETGGYHEIQRPRSRYRIIDREALAEMLGFADIAHLAAVHREWLESELRRGILRREAAWSEGVAVGRREFVRKIGERLGTRARRREVEPVGTHGHVLREAPTTYGGYFPAKMGGLRPIAT